VDPVGACVGVKGSRVQAIVRELGGERIDIVPWSDEPEIFIARALSPTNVSRVIVDQRRHHASILVDEDQLSLAIGKSGQNSKLAAQLTGWGLDIITEEEYQERRGQIAQSEQEFRRLSGVSELIALSLATSGFTSIKEIAESSVDLLKTVPGLEEKETIAELKLIAEAFAKEHKEEEENEPSEQEDPAAGAEEVGVAERCEVSAGNETDSESPPGQS
jgi:N utilization substance protein A